MISVLNGATIGQTPELKQFIALASRNGFGGIEFNVQDAADVSKEITQPAMIELFQAADIAPAFFGLPVDWRNDTSTFQSDLKKLPRLARMAQEMGCTATGTWLPPTVDQDERYFRSQATRRFHDIASILGDFDIRLALEWVGPLTTRVDALKRGAREFVWNLPATIELIADIDAPIDNVGLLVDSFHWFTTGATVEDIAALGAKVVYVHVNDAPDKPRDEQIDNQRLLPGDGVIDLDAFFEGLNGAGYTGYVAVETFNKDLWAAGPEEAARRAAEAMRRIL